MTDRDRSRDPKDESHWDTAPAPQEGEPSRYEQALSEHGDEPEYRISSDPAGVRGTAVGGRPLWPWLFVVLLLVLAAWALVEMRSTEDGSDAVPLPTADVEPPEVQPVVEAAPRPEPEPFELPPLDASDQIVAELVAELSSRPEIARYLIGEGLVRRFTAAVDNVAQGESPRAHLDALVPESRFTVTEADGTPRATPESYRRYDAVTAIFLSLDNDGMARLFAQMRPLVDEAYRELGYPDSSFDEPLRRAIDHLLATPTAPAGGALVPRGIGRTFEYEDERYERLSAAQKHLLRMGPDNAKRIQQKLRELRAALDL